ncbi:MAG: ankyrin repeat domain-containing protein [Cytophagaceae bacterium]|nr:ankyrin repeat domain-containing protein [Gemmatimonadaceae bacterium]
MLLDVAVAAFLDAILAQDQGGARAVLDTHPDLPSRSLHVAATLGLPHECARLITADPSLVHAKAGVPGAEPLLFLCYSPLHGESAEGDAGLLATARLLLDAGADPKTSDARYHVPALYAVTGLRSVPAIARLLLAAGANPTDGESLHHSAEHFHEDALELLLEAGGDVNHVGEWGNTPLYFLLRWHDLAKEPRVRHGAEWLLAHGADPNVSCGLEQEQSLHVAAWRGQEPEIVQLLLDHGADVHAVRGDGRTPWRLASRHGFNAIAALLERVGARAEALSPADKLLAACGRGDAADARRLASPDAIASLEPADQRLIVDAASVGRWPTVLACVAAGFDANTFNEHQSTALHHACLTGQIAVVHALLAAGASVRLRDSVHASTPLGWTTFGADHVGDASGDYPGCVRALLAAGAPREPDEYQPRRADVRAALEGA